MPLLCSSTEVASSLRCTELFSYSPSTSSSSSSSSSPQMHRHRRSLPAPMHSRVILGQLPQNRKRPLSDTRLNVAQHPLVKPITDLNIQSDPRALLSLLQTEEEHCSVNPRYMESTQTELTADHRMLVVEWLRDVLREERADPEVLPLAVLLLDLFLSQQCVFRRDVQTAASACLLIASKMKAPVPLNAARISFYTDNSVSVAQMMSWELLILKRLGWKVAIPTAMDFADQLMGREPVLSVLRAQFVQDLHEMQLRLKAASLPPSMQASLCLLSAALSSASLPLLEMTRRVILDHLQYLPANLEILLRPSCPLPTVESSPDSGLASRSESPTDVWCAPRSKSPPCTPGGSDSGFSSAVASPECAARPAGVPSALSPKLPRLMHRQSL